MLNSTEANVKTRLHRARQALRTLLEPLADKL
jgi:DNA-directed RNA polymerase specialized sigma24 family protein